MSIMDKAKDLIGGKKDSIKDGVDKAGDFVDEKTDSKHADKVDKAQDAAKGAIDKMSK